jgi:hypothetical protein
MAERYNREDLKREKLPFTQVRYVPEDMQTPAIVNVAGNITLLNIMGEEVTVFMIENKDVADSFRNQFEKLWSQETKVYKGKSGFMRAWLEAMDRGDTLYLIGAKGYFFDANPKEAMEIAEIARKKGIKWKNIVDEGTRGHVITKLDIAETRYLKERISAPGAIWICGDRTMISNWAKKEPIMVVIDNQEIADSYMDYFKILWNMAKP